MSIGFYTGVSGMIAYQQQMDILAHNVANVNTYGYKADRAGFADLLYTRMTTRVEGKHMVGHGTRVEKSELLNTQGALETTGFPLDFAILGEGFFGVQKGTGEIEYTRNGAFHLSMEGKKAFLTTSDGAYVLDKKGKALSVEVDAQGTPKLDGLGDLLGAFVFPNPHGLIQTDGSRFLPSDTSGQAVDASKSKLLQNGDGSATTQIVPGALERSTVDLGNEMVNVIQAQRAFQLNSRVVQTADQLDEVINNLR